MKLLQVLLTAFLSVFVLFFITRVGGRRQVTELSVFDYINGISIGSIAANAATASMEEFPTYLIGMLVFGSFALLLAFLTTKSVTLRHLFTGKPVILFHKGQFYRKEMSKMHVDMGEFLMLCRNQGYFSPGEIDTVLMETNGQFSILPVSAKKPLTPSDIKEPIAQEELEADIVIDGKIQESVLASMHCSHAKLRNELRLSNTPLSSVLLATLTPSGKITVYSAANENKKKEIE